MVILRIEHPVPDFAAWKSAFDGDPLGRERCGVKRYRVSRPLDDPSSVTVDLEFDDTDQAEAMREELVTLWQRVEGEGLIGNQRAQILEPVEEREY